MSEIILFEDKKIRRVEHKGEWWFVAIDIIAIISESKDPKGYLKDMRRRDVAFDEGWVQIATPLKIMTKGGPQQINCVNTRGALRLVQSIPSKKAEPFKRWLAQVGHERLQEISNPELAQERAKELYELKGYSKPWIDKRLRGIAVRQDLTDEWRKRGVEKPTDFAILTAEISKATFGMTPNEYKKFKNLSNENLRDHMTDLELIFSMLGEASTAELERVKDPKSFDEHKQVSKQGGTIAKNAKLELEEKSGRKVSSKENFLIANEKKKRLTR